MKFLLIFLSVLLLFVTTSGIAVESMEGQGIKKMGEITNKANTNEQNELRVLPSGPVEMQRIKKMQEMTDNTSTYEQMQLSNHTKFSLQDIYIPPDRFFPMSRGFYIEDIDSIVKVSFLRKKDQEFYTYFKYEMGKLFIFFTQDGRAFCMLCLPSIPLTIDRFDGIQEGVTTLEDVLRMDDSAIASKFTPRLLTRNSRSETTIYTNHVFANGDLLSIRFDLCDDEYLVTSYSLTEEFLSDYLSLILDIDK